MDNLPTPVGFASARQKFTSDLKAKHRSSATVIAYSSDLDQLQSHFEAQRITQVTTLTSQHLQNYLDKLATNGYTPKSVSRKINSLKTFFRFLHEGRLIPINPAAPLAHPKLQVSAPRILTPSECRALRETCRLDIRMCAVVETFLQTGIRISELANLQIEDFKKNEIHIRPLENNPARTVPVSKSLAAAIQNYLAIRPVKTGGTLFVTKTGRPLLIRNIRTSIDRYFENAGIKDAKVNDLRHTFIAYQLQAGVDPDYVAKVIGHKRLSSVARYFEHIKIPKATSNKLVEI